MAAGHRPSYHHGDLRAAMIAAGLLELEAHGVAGVSLRAVARRAGVSRTAPYHHFASKDELLAALATEGFRIIAGLQARVGAQSLDPRTRLRQEALLYYEAARAKPRLFQLMVGGALAQRERFEDLVAATAGARGHLRQGVAAFVDASESNANVDVVTAAVWSLVHGLGSLVLDGLLVPGRRGLPGHRALVERSIDLLLDGATTCRP